MPYVIRFLQDAKGINENGFEDSFPAYFNGLAATREQRDTALSESHSKAYVGFRSLLANPDKTPHPELTTDVDAALRFPITRRDEAAATAAHLMLSGHPATVVYDQPRPVKWAAQQLKRLGLTSLA